jgi:hypothetical protein
MSDRVPARRDGGVMDGEKNGIQGLLLRAFVSVTDFVEKSFRDCRSGDWMFGNQWISHQSLGSPFPLFPPVIIHSVIAASSARRRTWEPIFDFQPCNRGI